jgi:hypothetical protein
MSLPTRWIICTKWAVGPLDIPNDYTGVLDGNVLADEHKALQYFWTPVGSPHVYTKTSSIRGVPVSYATETEAIAGLTEIVNREPAITRQNLKFSVLEVRYVPNKIKLYKQDWHTKYVVKETELELKDHKFIDTMK